MGNSFVHTLAHRFSLKDLGSLFYVFGVKVVPTEQGILLSQRRYIMDLLARTCKTDAKLVLTLIPTSPSLMLSSGS
jgi:hypothetical protein